MIYLDYNATSPLHHAVVRGLKKNLPLFGNPSSLYQLGRQAKDQIEAVRYALSQTLDAPLSGVVFTGSGSEANNQVLKSVWIDALREGHPCHIIISAIEHACVRTTAQFLNSMGVAVTEVGVDSDGVIRLDELAAAIRPDTRLMSVMLANNETGTIQPLRHIVDIAAPFGVPVHTDAVQAFGKIPVSFSELGVDYMTISGHKIGAFKGLGAILCRDETRLNPLLHGGPQEKQKRAGTENVLGILSLGTVLEAVNLGQAADYGAVGELRDYFWDAIRTQIPEVVRNGNTRDTLPNTLNISFLAAKGDALLINLDLVGIAASTGSACSTGSIEPSYVLTAMGLTGDRSEGAVRFSLGVETTRDDIDRTVGCLVDIVGRLRRLK